MTKVIGAIAALCVGFAVWSGWDYRQSRSVGTLAVSLTFLVAAAALTYYLRHLKRFLGRCPCSRCSRWRWRTTPTWICCIS